MKRMRRGVGYCRDSECEDYAKGVFLLNHSETFSCPSCRTPGDIEQERGSCADDTAVFKEVRVEYNFDPERRLYREVAIVQDVSLWGRSNVYTLCSPLIRTEKRALKVAESILANLNRCPALASLDDVPSSAELVLSFDDDREKFQRKLESLAEEWAESGLRRAIL